MQINVSAINNTEIELAEFLEVLPDAHYLLDEEGNFVATNTMAEKIFGYKREDFLGKNFIQVGLLDKEHIPAIMAKYKESLKGKRTGPDEYEIRRKDGTKLYIELTTSSMVIQGNRLVAGSVRDVSDRVKNLLTIEQAKERLKFYVEMTGSIVLEVDKKGRILFINDSGCDILKCDAKSVIGTDFFADFIPESDRLRLKKLFNQAFLGKYTIQEFYNNEVIDKNGKSHTIRWRIQEKKDDSGKITSIVSSGHDISRIAELEFQKDIYKKGLLSSPNSVMLIEYKTKEPVIIDVNRGFEDLYGYSREEAMGKSPRILQSGLTEKDTYKAMWKAILDPKIGYWQHDMVNKTKSGELKIVILTVNSIFDDKGVVEYFLAHHVDVTEEREAQQRVAELDQLKSRFITALTHVTRTPLTEIRWNLESMLTGDFGKLTDEQKVFIRHALQSDKTVIDLIRDMNLVLDVERGTLYMDKTPASLLSIVNSAFQFYTARSQARNIEMALVPTKVKDLTLDMDVERIRAVVDILIDNAVTYTRDGGKVEVKIEKKGKNVLLKVKDTGIGIPEGEQQYIFDRFYRASNAATQYTDGVGVELYNARAIARAHGGDLTFTSTEGKGSEFVLKLPLK